MQKTAIKQEILDALPREEKMVFGPVMGNGGDKIWDALKKNLIPNLVGVDSSYLREIPKYVNNYFSKQLGDQYEEYKEKIGQITSLFLNWLSGKMKTATAREEYMVMIKAKANHGMIISARDDELDKIESYSKMIAENSELYIEKLSDAINNASSSIIRAKEEIATDLANMVSKKLLKEKHGTDDIYSVEADAERDDEYYKDIAKSVILENINQTLESLMPDMDKVFK